MKKQFIQICSWVGLLVGLAVSAQAQIGAQYRVYIPCDFNVGNKTLPAGDYVIKLTNPASGLSPLTILETKGGKTKIVQVIRNKTNERSKISKLVFNRYGNRYFLAEMNTPTLSARFQKTKVESRIAKNRKPDRETLTML